MNVNNSSEPQKVTMDLLPLTTAIDGLKTSINNFGVSFSKVKIDLSDGLEGSIKKAVSIAQTQMQAFVQSTVQQMSKSVTQIHYGPDGKPSSQTVTTTTMDQKSQQLGLAFDEKRLAAINEYNGLVKQQKMTFNDFASAIRKVTDRFMSISDLYAEGEKAQNTRALSKSANARDEDFLTVAGMIKNGGGASEGAAQELAVRMLTLLDSRNSKDPKEKEKFNQNKAIQTAKEHNPAFAKLLSEKDPTKIDKAVLFREFTRGLGLAYHDPETNKYDFNKMLDQYVDSNPFLQNLMKFNKEGLDPNVKPRDNLNYERHNLDGMFNKANITAKKQAEQLQNNSDNAITKGQTDDAWAANHAQSAAMSKKMLDDLAIWQQKMLKEHPEAIAIVNAVAAFTSGIINVIEGLMDFKGALAAILGLWGVKKLLSGGSGGPGAGSGGMGGFGCCCPCGPELQPQRAAQGAAGMASFFTASALAAVLGDGFKSVPDHVMASSGSSGQDYIVGSDYHAGIGNYVVPYQPKVSKEDIGQLGKDVHGALEKVNGALEQSKNRLYESLPYLIAFGVFASAIAALLISAPVAAGIAVGAVGIAAGSGKANAKELQKNRGLLEHTPPENIKGLVTPAEINRPSKNLNDSLDYKYQHPETRNRSMSSNAMDMEWARRNQTITQNITNHQIFHMNFNGSILQDPPSLTKNVASAMGNKAVASGGYTNIGASGTSA